MVLLILALLEKYRFSEIRSCPNVTSGRMIPSVSISIAVPPPDIGRGVSSKVAVVRLPSIVFTFFVLTGLLRSFLYLYPK